MAISWKVVELSRYFCYALQNPILELLSIVCCLKIGVKRIRSITKEANLFSL